MDVRNSKGEKVSLIPGMWYVGVNLSDDAPMIPANNWHWGAGIIAQYVGDNEFYEENDYNKAPMQDYDYIVEQNMGKL